MYAGVSPVSASATTTFVLWPASASSALTCRREIVAFRAFPVLLGAVSVAGGLLGGFLLVRTSDVSFMRLLPWLMLLAAAIISAPVGPLVPQALSHVEPGGTVVCSGIHMTDIPAFRYRLLWQERIVRSVANLTRQDARDFLVLAARKPIKTMVTRYALDDANRALSDLREGRLQGAAVLVL